MNLFVIAWNLPQENVPLVLIELKKMQTIFPLLDPATLWSFGNGKPVFAASMHNSYQSVSPRVYTAQTQNSVTLYDGCMLDPTASFSACDASDLSSNWPVLPDILEGQYFAARITTEPFKIEILNDFLGFYQAYYVEQDGTWLMSNSVELLSQITKKKALDLVGASLFLGLGWVGDDRTLRRGIRVIPPAQKWTWELNKNGPHKVTYFDRAQLSRAGQRRLHRTHAEQLANDLIAICQEAAKGFGPLVCPLTAGLDSRVLASLLIRGKVGSQYFTKGMPGSVDVEIAKRLAQQFELPHHWFDQGDKALLDAWQYHGPIYIQQTDGMASLATLGYDQMSSPEHLRTRLYGIGGEIARGFNYKKAPPHSLLTGRKFDHELLCRTIQGPVRNRRKLLCDKAIDSTIRYIDQVFLQIASEGFSALDQLDVFHTYERIRRWAGSTLRSFKSEQDKFSPFITRPFVHAAFSVSPIHRYQESLHHQLLSVTLPEMLSLPFEKEWHSQQPLINIGKFWLQKLARKIPRAIRPMGSRTKKSETTYLDSYNSKLTPRSVFFETRRADIRQLCLDQTHSPLWNLVDRSEFELMTSADIEPSERYRNIGILLDITTLFQYASYDI